MHGQLTFSNNVRKTDSKKSCENSALLMSSSSPCPYHLPFFILMFRFKYPTTKSKTLSTTSSPVYTTTEKPLVTTARSTEEEKRISTLTPTEITKNTAPARKTTYTLKMTSGSTFLPSSSSEPSKSFSRLSPCDIKLI